MTRFCSCGMITRSNPAWASHRKAHERRGEWEPRASVRAIDSTKHGALTMDQFRDKFPHVDLRGPQR